MSMKTKVFIDGSEGTTGLRINERFRDRDDIELLHISQELRKDPEERKRLINASDITFLCLPDEASRESVSLAENENVVVIDASTAHRTQEGWAYGFPELSKEHKAAIEKGKRIAVPGCYATGFISLVYPLIAGGILSERPAELSAGREYALTQQHKHLKEMKKITGLTRTPLFSPIIDDYYSGMVVSVPLYADMLTKRQTPESLLSYYAAYYENQRFIWVSAADDETAASGFLAGNGLSGWDGLKIYVTGNEERIVVSSQFDNLGKGASGAAIQCMNIVLGCDEAKGLNLNL